MDGERAVPAAQKQVLAVGGGVGSKKTTQNKSSYGTEIGHKISR